MRPYVCAVAADKKAGRVILTKKELSQLYWLNREIDEQQKKLKELELAATGCTARITGLPHGTGVTDKIGNYAAEIADLKSLIDLNVQKCFYELNRLNRYIQSVDDAQMRMILTLRYINGLAWRQVAKSIGEQDEQYPRKKHNAFLKLDEKDERNLL